MTPITSRASCEAINAVNEFCNRIFTQVFCVIINLSANMVELPEAGTVGQINSLFFVLTMAAAEKADSTRRHSKGGTCPGFQAVGSL